MPEQYELLTTSRDIVRKDRLENIGSLKRSRAKVDRGYVKIFYKLFNQKDQVVLALSCTSLVKCRVK